MGEKKIFPFSHLLEIVKHHPRALDIVKKQHKTEELMQLNATSLTEERKLMKKGSSSQVSDISRLHFTWLWKQFKGKTDRMCLGRHPEANRLMPAASPRHGREVSG